MYGWIISIDLLEKFWNARIVRQEGDCQGYDLTCVLAVVLRVNVRWAEYMYAWKLNREDSNTKIFGLLVGTKTYTPAGYQSIHAHHSISIDILALRWYAHSLLFKFMGAQESNCLQQLASCRYEQTPSTSPYTVCREISWQIRHASTFVNGSFEFLTSPAKLLPTRMFMVNCCA